MTAYTALDKAQQEKSRLFNSKHHRCVEVSALFCSPTHKHDMKCADQFLRNSLKDPSHRFCPNEA